MKSWFKNHTELLVGILVGLLFVSLAIVSGPFAVFMMVMRSSKGHPATPTVCTFSAILWLFAVGLACGLYRDPIFGWPYLTALLVWSVSVVLTLAVSLFDAYEYSANKFNADFGN